MREQKSLECSGARATTPHRFQVVALDWKAAVEGDAAHLTIHACRWLASNGRQIFSPTVRFIGASYETSGNDKHSGNHFSNFNICESLRQEVKDGHSLRRSIHSYGRFDRFQRCGFTADGAFLTPWTMPPQVTF